MMRWRETWADLETFRSRPPSLGVERHDIVHTDAHVRRHTTTLSPGARRWLADLYRPHNERFLPLLGRDVAPWTSTEMDSARMVTPG